MTATITANLSLRPTWIRRILNSLLGALAAPAF